jgi:ABC-type multidrug transport system fused ATPase/permease subunit
LKEKNTAANYSILNNAVYLMRDIRREWPLLFAYITAELAFGSVLPLFYVYLPKMAVDLAAQHASTGRTLLTLGVAAALFILVNTVTSAASGGKYMMYNSMRTYYARLLLYKFVICDYELIESAGGQTRYSKARQSLDGGDWSGTSRMVANGVALITGAVSLFLYAGLVIALNPLFAAALVILAGTNYFVAEGGRKFEEKQRDKTSELHKKIRYIENASSDLQAAKDVRIYSLKNWFLEIRSNLMKDYVHVKRLIQRRYFVWGLLRLLSNLLRDGLAYGYLIYRISEGGLSAGDFVLYTGAVAAFTGNISGLVGQYSLLTMAKNQMNDMRSFLELSDAPAPADPAPLPDLNAPLSVEFNNVSFSYDGGGRNVLDNFNLKIRPGEKLALVGVNGAGKTTLVKLLCGFYKPGSGSILLNGTDISRFAKEDLMRMFSAVFQDISLFAFTVAENVSMKPFAETDERRVRGCLKKAGLLNEIEESKNGLRSPISKSLDEDGIVLSGGQQQKLLMARALYKNAPVLILDEPTSALDPIAESQTYGQFNAFSESKTAIYISHRLASTKFCDRIAFLENGKLAELGSHDELLKRGGGYAKMFEVQSHYYIDGAIQ